MENKEIGTRSYWRDVMSDRAWRYIHITDHKRKRISSPPKEDYSIIFLPTKETDIVPLTIDTNGILPLNIEKEP